MRVTQTMLQNNMLNNLFQSQANMDKYLTQIHTGKKINRASDDPVIAMKGISYRTEVIEAEQYSRNATEIWNWFDHSDDILGKATGAVQRMEELAVQAANGTNTADELKAIKKEVEQLKEQMIEIANTKVNGKHIFNGTDTNKPLIEVDDDGNLNFNEGNGRTETVDIEVSKGIKMDVNINPDGVFDEELFENIDNFINALDVDNEDELDEDALNQSIGDLQASNSNIIQARAELGARMNRLELIEDRLDQQVIIAKDTMMENEGVQFEEAVTNLMTQEVIHRAALAAGSKIIQPSLLDFLR